ncbi:protein of unknown function [Methylocaldum szegediense]|uniref:Uncharacterized protein n=1 Tax=Methylocaldum szegediense TaxID=73780 RepID=A0ABM9HVW1_9GAMM|nr:protein of unknown function [Methylocaldum szegediense]
MSGVIFTSAVTGDALLLILLATSFGIVYGLFVISLTALGLWLTQSCAPFRSLCFPYVNGFRNAG